MLHLHHCQIRANTVRMLLLAVAALLKSTDSHGTYHILPPLPNAQNQRAFSPSMEI